MKYIDRSVSRVSLFHTLLRAKMFVQAKLLSPIFAFSVDFLPGNPIENKRFGGLKKRPLLLSNRHLLGHLWPNADTFHEAIGTFKGLFG